MVRVLVRVLVRVEVHPANHGEDRSSKPGNRPDLYTTDPAPVGPTGETTVGTSRRQRPSGGHAAPTTVETLQTQLDDPQVVQATLDDPVKHIDLAMVTGLVLGAPEFQRR